MKTLKYIITMCLLITLNSLLAQNTKTIKNSLIPDKFTIFYLVNLTDTINPEFMQNYPNVSLNEIVLNKIFNSEIKTYNYSQYDDKILDTLTTKDAKEAMGAKTMEIYVEDVETGMQTVKYFETSANPNEIVKYRFQEEWKLDEKNFKFTKNIISYSPIRKFFKDDDPDMISPCYKIAFTIFNDKRGQIKPVKTDKWTLLTKAVYEVILVENFKQKYPELSNSFSNLSNEDYTVFENENSPFLNSITQQKMALLFYKKAMDENTITYSSEGFYQPKQSINDALNVRDVLVSDYSENVEVLKKIHYDFNPQELKSILFFEDWYINEATLQFDKRITAIAPVRYYFREDDYDDNSHLKRVPFLIYTNNEDPDRLEKLYYKLIFRNYNYEIISHLELFYLLGKQTKSPVFKSFCSEKQNDLYTHLLKNDLATDEKIQLYFLSEKIKLGYSLEKLTNTKIEELDQMFKTFSSYTDTCMDEKKQLNYYSTLKFIGEKLLKLNDNCTYRINLLKIYEKLNLTNEIAKWQQSTDKPWLTECLADYYLKSANPEKKKIGIVMYQKLHNKTLNCKMLTMYLDLPPELKPQNLDIDNFIATQNQTELECFGKYLDNKYNYEKDSLIKIEGLKISEKVYSKLTELAVTKECLIGLYESKIAQKKSFNFDLLTQLSAPDDIIFILSYLFNGGNHGIPLSQNDLIACKPAIEKLATLNVDEDNLWTFLYSVYLWNSYGAENKNKTYLDFLEILLNKILVMNPNSIEYQLGKYELQLAQGENPDISSMLNQSSQNIEAFAIFFSNGFKEYIYADFDKDPSKCHELYLLNAARFYEKLVNLQPDNKEFAYHYSEVYYKLNWIYIYKNQPEKALECALKINKIDNSNDFGIIATIFGYMVTKQTSKAYKLTDSYKQKQRDSKTTYLDFFKNETERILSYKNDLTEISKFLEYINK